MIRDVVISHICEGDDDGRKYGFGVLPDDSQVYIPGNVVRDWELSNEDVGTTNTMVISKDRQGRTDYVAHSLVVDDSALQQAHEWLKDENERLRSILDDNNLEYD